MTGGGVAASDYLEVARPGGLQVVLLTGPTVTIGRAAGNGLVLDHDPQVSSLHAVLQAYGSGWAVRDLGSTNGTVVAGERLHAERALRHGDLSSSTRGARDAASSSPTRRCSAAPSTAPT